MNFGKAIKTCRMSKGLTQEGLALKSHISKSYLSQIEMNKKSPTIDVIKQLSDALKIPLNILFFIASDKEDIKELNQELIDKLSTISLKLMKDE